MVIIIIIIITTKITKIITIIITIIINNFITIFTITIFTITSMKETELSAVASSLIATSNGRKSPTSPTARGSTIFTSIMMKAQQHTSLNFTRSKMTATRNGMIPLFDQVEAPVYIKREVA